MNDNQLIEALNSAGMWCFVEYFNEFTDDSLTDQHIADRIAKEKRGPTGKRLSPVSALHRRVRPCRRIIYARRVEAALAMISSSTNGQVAARIKERAIELARLRDT